MTAPMEGTDAAGIARARRVRRVPRSDEDSAAAEREAATGAHALAQARAAVRAALAELDHITWQDEHTKEFAAVFGIPYSPPPRDVVSLRERNLLRLEKAYAALNPRRRGRPFKTPTERQDLETRLATIRDLFKKADAQGWNLETWTPAHFWGYLGEKERAYHRLNKKQGIKTRDLKERRIT